MYNWHTVESNNYWVAIIYKLYSTAIEIIISSLKSIWQFKHTWINSQGNPLSTNGGTDPNDKKLRADEFIDLAS